jgi:hypothetical protein
MMKMEPHRPETLSPGQRTDPDEPQLEAARAEFPGWEIERAWHGYTARPKGTPVIESMFLSGLVDKLRETEGGS